MSQQDKRGLPYEDEINLYDYWKVIVKRKGLIIGLFLVATIASGIISLLMPKIYRGEVVLKLPEKQSQSSITITAKEITAKEITAKEITAKEITAKELVSIIGKIDKEKIKNFLPTTHHLITDIKLNALKDSADKLKLIIEAKNTNDISTAMTEFVTYLNNIPIIKLFVEEERQRLLIQSEEINKVIESSTELLRTYKKLLNRGTPLVGFSPIEVEKRASDLKVERLVIEQGIKRLKGVEMITSLNIPC